MWRPPPGQGRKGIIQKMSLHCLGKEKKNTARTRQAQRRSSAEWLPRWACEALGSQSPCSQGRVSLCCCAVTVGGQLPCSGLAHLALMVEKRLPAHLAQSTKQILRAAHSWGTM